MIGYSSHKISARVSDELTGRAPSCMRTALHPPRVHRLDDTVDEFLVLVGPGAIHASREHHRGGGLLRGSTGVTAGHSGRWPAEAGEVDRGVEVPVDAGAARRALVGALGDRGACVSDSPGFAGEDGVRASQ